MKPSNVIFVGILLLSLLQIVTSAKILALYFFGSKSQKGFATPIVKELASRGHDIVFVSGYKESKPVKGIKEVISDTSIEKLVGFNRNVFEEREEGILATFSPLLNISDLITELFDKSFTTKEVHEMMTSNQKFDLVLVNGFVNEFAYGWIHQLQAPVIMISAGSPFPWMLHMMGNPLSMSHIDKLLFATNDDDCLSFLKRTANTAFLLTLTSLRENLFLPMVDRIIRTRFPEHPGIKEVEKNMSLVLVNSHFSVNGPRPYLPSLVDVGGAHCQPANPLPEDLENFVDGSGEHGFILFSFGSVVKASDMPDKYRKMFLQVFSKLPQRVLWKWETENMDDLPKNVKLSKWLPQQDLLGHPKCRAFITHGGGHSTQEANYHGVPLLGIPFFGDQDMNMRAAEQSGYAIKLELKNLTANLLQESLQKILTDQKFKEKVHHLSTLFRDQPNKPLDRAVYWVEYVIRHRGAPHLKSEAANHHWSQNLLADILAFLAFLFATVVFVAGLITYFIIKLMCKIFCRGKKKASDKKKKE